MVRCCCFATMLFIGSALSINAAPYGACSYSTGDFSASADCEPDTGSLPGTGRNWNNLLFAALGLLLGVSSLITVIILMKKRSPRGIKT